MSVSQLGCLSKEFSQGEKSDSVKSHGRNNSTMLRHLFEADLLCLDEVYRQEAKLELKRAQTAQSLHTAAAIIRSACRCRSAHRSLNR